MIDSKYNPFIVCFLHNCEEYLFSRDGHLLYPIPFGNYKVAESKEDAKRKFINGNSGYFIDSTYEYLEEGINDYKSLKIDEIK